MRTEVIIHRLAQDEGFPEEAIRAAREQRQEMAPLLVGLVERYLAREAGGRELAPALFFAFHLLGEWRERSAYRPLARLLATDPDELDGILGDAITSTSHRVMSAVFDGDPRPLQEVIEAEQADPFVRSRMLETLALLVLRGELERDEVATYLRDGFMTLMPHGHNFVWHGWQSAIAMLGLKELSGLVKKAFDRGLIHRSEMSFEDFRSDLKFALKHPDEPWPLDKREFALFEDTIAELSRWYAFSPQRSEPDKAPGRPAAGTGRAGGQPVPGRRTQRSLSLRQRPEVQEVLSAVTAQEGAHPWSRSMPPEPRSCAPSVRPRGRARCSRG